MTDERARRRAMRDEQLAVLWAGKRLAENSASAEPEPPPLAPLNRVAEILEAMWNLEPELTAELLGLLRQFDGPALAKIFGSPVTSQQTPPTPAAVDVQSVPAAPATEAPADAETHQEFSHQVTRVAPPESPYEAEKAWLRANIEAARYDEHGKRLNPGQRAFPRRYEPRQRPPGTTWLSD